MISPCQPRCRPSWDGAAVGSLSPNLCHLLNRIWRLRYGYIRELQVRAGDPLFTPPFLIVRTARFADTDSPLRAAPSETFTIRREHIAFQRELAAIGDGVIDLIKVHDGLPVVLEITERD